MFFIRQKNNRIAEKNAYLFSKIEISYYQISDKLTFKTIYVKNILHFFVGAKLNRLVESKLQKYVRFAAYVFGCNSNGR